MKKINFTNATVTAQASVEIDGVSHDVTSAVIEGGTLPTPDNINQLQNNVEEAILNPVVESIECKNKFDMNGNILESIGYTSGTNTLESGKIKSTANIANGNGKGQIIQLKPNTVYTYSVKISSFEVSGSTCLRISPVNSEGNAVGYLVDQNITCEVGKVYSYSFTTSDTGKIWVMLNGISNSEDYSILKYIVYDYVQIEEGNTATSYTSFKRYGYDSKESMGSIIVDDIRSKNLVNRIIYGYELGNLGATNVNQNWFITDYIPVVPGETYTQSGFSSNYAEFTNSNKEYVSDSRDKTFQVPNGACYVRLNGSIATSSNMQLELGSTATNYSEYKKLDTDIYSFDTNLTYNSASPQSFQNAILKNAKLVICNFHSKDGNWDIQTQHLTSGTSFTSMQTSTNWYVASNFDSTLGKITFITKSDNSNFVLNKITVVK